MSSAGARLRSVLAQPGCALAIGAHDPVVAMLVERAGAPVVYVSGSGTSTTVAGFPDVGLVSFSEMLDHARYVIAATSLPAFCDIDTGYGNATNVARTIREYEAIGAAGVHLEDQLAPKRCGQTMGATLVPVEEMQQKLYAAKSAQRDSDFVVIARCDARQCEGLDALVERCRAYVAAGADAIFPEALLDHGEFVHVREQLDVPLVIDLPEWGRTPAMGLDELERTGFDLGIYAVSALRVALGAVRSFISDLVEQRTQESWLERMMSRADLDELLGLPDIREREQALASAFEVPSQR